MIKIKKILKIVLVLCVFVLLVLFYAFKIEPYQITVKNYTLDSRQTQQANQANQANQTQQTQQMQLKIIQLSDIEISPYFSETQLVEIVRKVNAQKPDLVFFTGDLYENYYKYGPKTEVIDALKAIQSTYGKFAIWGNNDYGGGGVRVYEEIMSQGDFNVLKNSGVTIQTKDGKSIFIGGLDDALMGVPVMNAVFETKQDVDYSILLAHEPSAIFDIGDHWVDLMLSGHTHGGQIGIVSVRKLMHIETDYLSGFYPIDNHCQTDLIVSNGIGTSRIHARIWAPPQIISIRINF